MASLKKIAKCYKRDVINLIRFGSLAPLSCQRIFIDPRKVDYVIASGIFGREDSGRVVAGDWDTGIIPLSGYPKYIVCHERFVNHKDWEEAGAYDLMLKEIKKTPGADRCYTKKDIINRYERIDSIYKLIKKEKRVRYRREIKPTAFRESGGIYVHIDRNGRVIFGGGGYIGLLLQKYWTSRKSPHKLAWFIMMDYPLGENT